MEIIRSTPRELNFFKTFEDWLAAQDGRLWVITPFVDKIGVSLLNSVGHAKDMKLITRRNKELVNLKSGITIKMMPEIHVKLYIGDNECFFGSLNLTVNSLMDSLEMVMKFTEASVMQKVVKYFEVLWV